MSRTYWAGSWHEFVILLNTIWLFILKHFTTSLHNFQIADFLAHSAIIQLCALSLALTIQLSWCLATLLTDLFLWYVLQSVGMFSYSQSPPVLILSSSALDPQAVSVLPPLYRFYNSGLPPVIVFIRRLLYFSCSHTPHPSDLAIPTPSPITASIICMSHAPLYSRHNSL